MGGHPSLRLGAARQSSSRLVGVPDGAACAGRGGQRGLGGGVGEGVGVGFLGEDEIEVAVELFDESVLGAEVCGEPQAREGQVAEALGAHGPDEALDPRLAEEVDGLARIADQEDGLPVAVPVGREQFDELVLAGGGVLHLIDQEVLQARAERGGQVFGAGVCAEGGAGEEGNLGVVALVVGGEDELEFDQSAAEDAEEALGDGPLVGGVAGGGQGANILKGEEQFVAVAELIENRDETGVIAVFSVVDKPQEPAGEASFLAQVSILRQEQVEQSEPVVEVRGKGLQAGCGGRRKGRWGTGHRGRTGRRGRGRRRDR